MPRAAFPAFQPGVLFAQFGDGLLQGGYLTEQFDQQRFKLRTVQRGKVGGEGGPRTWIRVTPYVERRISLMPRWCYTLPREYI
jgi:hypothetical protein